MSFWTWLKNLFSKKKPALVKPDTTPVVAQPPAIQPVPLLPPTDPVVDPPVLPPGFETAPDADGRVVLTDLQKKNSDCLFLTPLTILSFDNLTDRQLQSIVANCGCNADGSIRNADGTPVPFFDSMGNAPGASAVEFFTSYTQPVQLLPRYPGATEKTWRRAGTWPDLAKGVKTVAARFDSFASMVAYANAQPNGRVGPVEFPTDPGRAKIS